MSTVAARQRGSASGINVLVGNTGQMLSIALAFPFLVSFGITLVAALASALRPLQSTRELHAEYS